AAHALAAGGTVGAPLASDLRRVRTDIRALAEGLHPAAFADGGLEGALGALAARSTIPVDVHAVATGLPRPIEREAWFVCSEALANAVKHSGAARARVRVLEIDGVVHIEITDDGRGGADPARGSGLRGMAERVEALGGRMSVADRPGGGTVLVAELPAR